MRSLSCPPARPAAALLLLGALGALACSPEPPVQPPPSPSGAPAPVNSALLARTGWDDAPWGRFHSRRFSLWLSLPDGKTWRINDHKTSWLTATHAPSSSSLALTSFTEDHAVNRDRCEKLARERDPSLPSESRGRVLSRQEEGVLPGWHARSFVTSELKSAPHAVPVDLEGHLVAFAAQVRTCVVVHFATRAVGPDADAVLGARLGEAAGIVRKLERVDELQGPSAEPASSAR